MHSALHQALKHSRSNFPGIHLGITRRHDFYAGFARKKVESAYVDDTHDLGLKTYGLCHDAPSSSRAHAIATTLFGFIQSGISERDKTFKARLTGQRGQAKTHRQLWTRLLT